MENNRQRDLLQEFVNKPKQMCLTDEQSKKTFESTVAACEDIYHIYIEKDNNIVIKARFEGNGCAVSFGSVEALLRVIENKTTDEVKDILNKYELLIDGEIKETKIEELDVFQIVQSHVSRKKCARAPIGAIRKAIK